MTIQLEQYYPGDNDWFKFIKEAPNYLESYAKSDILIKALRGNYDLASVIFAIIGEDSIDWIQRPKKMLDSLAPVDCLDNDQLLKRFRTMLMRMGG